MRCFKLGCNWGSGNPDFYSVLKKHSIVICREVHKMKKGDYVAIANGYTIKAIAQIIEDRVQSTSRPELQEDFSKYQITYDKDVYVASAKIWELPKADRFKYELQQGICGINQAETLQKIKSLIDKFMGKTIFEECTQLLRANYNIVLTGAPGTGKTYLAKEIAKSIGAEYEFVQFHPSYDYTDFVEGLRPVEKDGKLGFERRDGIFKAFCKQAIKGFSLRAAFNKLLEDIKSGEVTTIPLRTKESNILKISPRECITWETYQDESKDSTLVVSFDRLKRLYKHFDSVEKLDRISNIDEEFRAVIGACKSSYYWAVLRHLLANKQKAENPHPFVFIIDEINRGEISKIFGELFYAIDSGYRGEKGRINTQYQNLVPEDDPFYEGFYIPENVYIIGTMNDIDRSVECMDFAMRRRFAWKEITVESRQSMLDDPQAWSEQPNKAVIAEIKARMNNLNACIIDEYNKGGEVSKDRIGLTKAYQIGASYFLKYGLYNNFDALWDNHIKGLLYEYLRGTSNIEDKIAKLKEAYQDANP